MKYRKKPVVIEAIQWDGKNYDEICDFIGEQQPLVKGKIAIDTLEGTVWASEADWVIKGIKGEFYPCKPDIFAETYEAVTIKESKGKCKNDCYSRNVPCHCI